MMHASTQKPMGDLASIIWGEVMSCGHLHNHPGIGLKVEGTAPLRAEIHSGFGPDPIFGVDGCSVVGVFEGERRFPTGGALPSRAS